MITFLIGLYVGGLVAYGGKDISTIFHTNIIKSVKQLSKGAVVLLVIDEITRFLFWPYYLSKDLINVIPTKDKQ